jgi:hypothetical protein
MCLDGDVICTKKDNFGNVPVLLDVENDLRLNDSGVVEMQARDFFVRVVAQGISHLLVSDRDGYRQIDVGSLHGG